MTILTIGLALYGMIATLGWLITPRRHTHDESWHLETLSHFFLTQPQKKVERHDYENHRPDIPDIP
jgi:hypothetical protein